MGGSFERGARASGCMGAHWILGLVFFRFRSIGFRWGYLTTSWYFVSRRSDKISGPGRFQVTSLCVFQFRKSKKPVCFPASNPCQQVQIYAQSGHRVQREERKKFRCSPGRVRRALFFVARVPRKCCFQPDEKPFIDIPCIATTLSVRQHRVTPSPRPLPSSWETESKPSTCPSTSDPSLQHPTSLLSS